MDPIILSIGVIDIRWYSVCILVGAIIGISLLIKEAKKFNYNTDFIFNLAFWSIIMGFIGARLYYVGFNFSLYQNDLLSILEIWNGGLAIHGGIIFGLLTAFIYTKKYKVSTLKIIDMAVPSLIIAQAIGRWGNFFNSEAYGSVVSKTLLQSYHIPEFIIDGMYINGNYHHPTFYYEFVWCLIGFVILLIIRRLKFVKAGQLTAFYLMWYSVGRFIIESLRTDSLMFGAFKTAQIASIIMFVIGIIIFVITSRKSKFEGLYNSEEGVVKF